MINDQPLNLSYLSFHRLYNGNTVGQQFGPKCCRGDRIGCGISLDSDDGQLTVFFTKNGKEVSAPLPPYFFTLDRIYLASAVLHVSVPSYFSSKIQNLNVRLGRQCGGPSSSWRSLPCCGYALSGGRSAAGPECWMGHRGGWWADDSG